MKKNKMMRTASGLLVAVLLTTCIISGTFAKYVTEGSASDTARVAKWGVKVVANANDLFTKTYATDDTTVNETIELSVKSANDVDVVAPGTKGDGASVTITGTPEVAVRVKYDATVTLSDWKIDHDGNAETDSIYYCPLVVTVGSTELNGLSYASADLFAAAIKAEILKVTGAGSDGVKDYGPNTSIANSANLAISWSWPFEAGDDADAKTVTNKKDTLLGNKETADTIYIAYSVNVSQID